MSKEATVSMHSIRVTTLESSSKQQKAASRGCSKWFKPALLIVFLTLCIYCFVSLHVLKYLMFDTEKVGVEIDSTTVDPLGAIEIINWASYTMVMLLTTWSFCKIIR